MSDPTAPPETYDVTVGDITVRLTRTRLADSPVWRVELRPGAPS